MKLKRLPEDFRVDEVLLPELAPATGTFALYRLSKQSLGTLEAVAAIARHWKLPREAMAFAGLKDKHALTTQYITIQGGPRRGLKQTNLALEYLGQTQRPIHASDIAANQFKVVIRNLDLPAVERAVSAAAAISLNGIPNYFDDQRFGSLGQSGEFIALPWCCGNYERTLWLAMADANVHDSPQVREEKLFLCEHWGDWPLCRRQLFHSRFAGVLEHLAHEPHDFRRAIARVPQDLRSLWLATFQSHLWNQILAALIQETLSPESLAWHSIGGRRLPFFTQLNDDQRKQLQSSKLPLPSARLHLSDERLGLLYDNVLSREGLALREIRVKYPRDSFFSKGDRDAIFAAGSKIDLESSSDDVYPGRQKLKIRFSLRRGSYATMLVKQIVGKHLLGADEQTADEHDMDESP